MDPTIIAVFVGIVTTNLIIMRIKAALNRWSDLTLDIGAMIALNYMFLGTLQGAIIANASSLVLSIYLFIFPPKFLSMD